MEFLQAGDIAYVSCEPSDYSEGNISAGSTISLAVNAKPEAIVLYSVYAYTCNFSPSAEFQDLLIYTMQNASSSTAVVDGLQRNNPPYPYTTIFENQTSSTEAVDSQTSSTGTPKKENLITGLVFGFVTPIPVVALGLYYVCITRRRPPRKQQITPAKPSGKKPHVEEDSAQLYLQRKAELDDEQRRHEMEVVEIRCEMDGENEIHEMPAEARGRHFGRQELRGKEHSVEMESAL